MGSLAATLTAGVVSAALYVVVTAVGLGFLFLFLPTLPIFWLGMTRRVDESLRAGLVGVLIVSVVVGPIYAVFGYWLLLALPAWYIAREAMKRIGNSALVLWFPLTVIFTHLMTAFSFILLGVVLLNMGHEGGFSSLMGHHLRDAFEALPPELARLDAEAKEMLMALASTLAFLVVAISAWMWAACLYVHGWIVNRELMRQKIALRPDMRILAVAPPTWLISLMVICAFASSVGSPSFAFWGKASLLILLFPYFLFGLALLHLRVRAMPSRTMILFMLYVLLAILLWPALLIAGYGVLRHLKVLAT